MNIRIKEVRKALNLTQRDFGCRVGVKDNAISRIESGERNLTEQMLLALCKEYTINENWLRTGEGEMFVEDKNDLIHQLSKQYDLNALDRKLVEIYISLPKAQREVLQTFALKLTNTLTDMRTDIETSEEIAPIRIDEDAWSQYSKGLTPEEMHMRLETRIDAAKGGVASSTTSAKDGTDLTLKKAKGM